MFESGHAHLAVGYNRRRHRPLRAILPDPPGSAAAVVGQRERVATIKR
jgi:hypothetical protein